MGSKHYAYKAAGHIVVPTRRRVTLIPDGWLALVKSALNTLFPDLFSSSDSV